MKVTSPTDLNERITLQYPTRVSDGKGGFTVTWATIATVWAKMTPHRSDEAIQAMATTGTAIYNYRIRYRTDVASSWRIIHNGRYMAIVGPPMKKVEGSQQYLDLTAKGIG